MIAGPRLRRKRRPYDWVSAWMLALTNLLAHELG
jgi:hypothetical protein